MTIELEPISPEKAASQKRQIMYVLFVAMLIEGLLSAYAEHAQSVRWLADSLGGPIIIGVAVAWCSIEARAEGEMLGVNWVVGLFLLTPICFPLYVIKERGYKPGGIFLAKAFGALFAASALSVVAKRLATLALST